MNFVNFVNPSKLLLNLLNSFALESSLEKLIFLNDKHIFFYFDKKWQKYDMTLKILQPLEDDLEKYNAYQLPSSVRAIIVQALSFIKNKDIRLPISSIDSPLIRFFNTLFMNPNLIRLSENFSSIILYCIQNDIFDSDLYEYILSNLVNMVNEFDSNCTLHFIHSAYDGILVNFPNLNSLKTYFSMFLSLMTHKNDILSTTAVASFPKIIEILVETIKKFDKNNEQYDKYIDYCNKNYGDLFRRFSEPLHFILYLLLNDLVSLALKQKITWVLIKNSNISTIFDILDLILTSYSDLLQESNELLFLFEGTVIQSMNDINAIQFILTFIQKYYLTHKTLCSSIFSDFLQRLLNRENYIPLYFFKILSNTNTDSSMRIFFSIDEDFHLHLQLITSLVQIVENREPLSSVEFSFKQPKIHANSSERSKFMESAPFEICFCLLNTLNKYKNDKHKALLNASYNNFYKIVSVAFKLSTSKSFYHPINALIDLIDLMIFSELKTELKQIFTEFCKYTKDNVNEEDKKQLISECFISILTKQPDCCTNLFEFILPFILDEHVKLPNNFGTNFNDVYLVSLLRISLEYSPIPFDFVSELVLINHYRFSLLWSYLQKYYESITVKFDLNILKSYLILLKNLNKEDEECILETLVKLISPSSSIPPKYKGRILSKFRQMFSENISIIQNGWKHVFNILSPLNYESNTSLLQSSFNVLNYICNDCFDLVPKNYMESCIDLIINFAIDQTDINLSLSSFDLLWNVVRIMEGTAHNWICLFDKITKLIQDDRADVSQCAVRTLFSLVSSNFNQIPKEVILFLITKDFPFILSILDINSPSTYSLILQELAHHSSAFWETFDQYEQFKNTFLPNLIFKARYFCLNCNNYEAVVSSFQFFDYLFQCLSLDKKTEGELVQLLSEFAIQYSKIQDNSSIIFASFGKLMKDGLLSLKKRNAIDGYRYWIPIIKDIAYRYQATGFVHITAQRTLDAITLLFPLNEELTSLTVDLLINIILNLKDAVQIFAVRILTTIFAQKIENDYKEVFLIKCKPIYSLKQSENLVKLFFEEPFNLTNNDIYECYLMLIKDWPSYDTKGYEHIVKSFNKLTKDKQQEFLISNSQNFQILSNIWKYFMSPQSKYFDNIIFTNNHQIVLNEIQAILHSENYTQQILEFLLENELPPKLIGENETTKWFLISFMPIIIQHLSNNDKAVFKLCTELLMTISNILSTVITNK